jgi:TonB family protein
MSSESGGVSERGTETTASQNRTEQIGALGGCLLEGDAEQSQREKKVRRRALVTSTLLQAAALAAVIALPLLAKVDGITVKDWTPMPPYHPYGGGERQHPITSRPQVGQKPAICFVCPQAHPAEHSLDTVRSTNVDGEFLSGDGFDSGNGLTCAGCINDIGKTEGPTPPSTHVVPQAAIVHVTHIDPAMLVDRIEPVYPPLARQTRRSGRVELHAIISADGRIESLEIVSGDVLFLQSALDAVRRWKYRPTVLNGAAVKVDTYITVNYTMAE